MNNSISLAEMLSSTMAGAAIVLFGALYALFFALGKLQSDRRLIAAALLAYSALAIAALILIASLHLKGFWLLVTGAMLAGYFFAPRAIWNLCVGTHSENDRQS